MNTSRLFFYVAALIFTAVSLQAQQQKYALVIGAQNYTSLPPLRNSLTDAKDLTNVLRSKGFKVETLLDPKTKAQLKDAIIRYRDAMQNVVGGVGIIFYAGHGMQFEGNNYVIPTTAKLELSSDLDDQCLKMNAVMSVLNSTNK
ncbi:MAG: caspase family protein, partial [Cytophagales bacterium]|nr:caspase family protein [Cytophagales bacterium]